MVQHRRNEIPLVKWSKGIAVNYLWGEFIERQGDESSEPSIPLFYQVSSFPLWNQAVVVSSQLKSLLAKTLLCEYLQFQAERPLRSGHTEWQISSEMLWMICKKLLDPCTTKQTLLWIISACALLFWPQNRKTTRRRLFVWPLTANGISLTLHGLLIVNESLQLTGCWGEQVNERLKSICFEFN